MKRVLITLAVNTSVKDINEAIIVANDLADPYERQYWNYGIEILEVKILDEGDGI